METQTNAKCSTNQAVVISQKSIPVVYCDITVIVNLTLSKNENEIIKNAKLSVAWLIHVRIYQIVHKKSGLTLKNGLFHSARSVLVRFALVRKAKSVPSVGRSTKLPGCIHFGVFPQNNLPFRAIIRFHPSVGEIKQKRLKLGNHMQLFKGENA
uniref:(northern house mosquito) hypothetical protein n=1 Tax=Culex pipiens TaxID=7175 RepID=A0A8D8CM89_CULPI